MTASAIPRLRAALPTAMLAVAALIFGSASADDPAPASVSAAGRPVSIVTATDEKITGSLSEVRDGVLQLDGQPPRSVELLDLQSLTFNAAAGVSVQFAGQDQHDFVQVGAPLGGNGIQDVHLRLRGLPSQKQIKQLRIVLRTPPRAWLLDPADSPNWRLFIERAANSSGAEVYFEPPAADLMDKELQITLTYNDDTTEKLTCTGTSHTSDQLHIGAAKTDGQPGKSPDPNVVVDLGGGDQVHGTLTQLSDDSLALQTPWQANLQIPLLEVQGFVVQGATPDAKKRYDTVRAKPSSDDLALVVAKDGKLAEIAGRVKGWQEHQLHFVYEGKEETLPAERLQALVLAAHPPRRPSAAAFQVVKLVGDDTLSGNWQALSGGNLTLKMPWDATWEIPVESVAEINTRNGNLVQLSDLQPAAVEQTPYFGRLMPFRRDQALDGGALKMKSKTYPKGLAVHSRCVLSYALDGQFSKFKATLGFDEAAGTKGNVSCRVLADGKELFAKPELRADQDPQLLDLSVQGAKTLALEVDFGAGEDVGDRVIWADARLFRK